MCRTAHVSRVQDSGAYPRVQDSGAFTRVRMTMRKTDSSHETAVEQ